VKQAHIFTNLYLIDTGYNRTLYIAKTGDRGITKMGDSSPDGGAVCPKAARKHHECIPARYALMKAPDPGLHQRDCQTRIHKILRSHPAQFDTACGRQLAVLESYERGSGSWFAFSRDETKLAMAGWNYPAQICDLELIRTELAEMKLSWENSSAPTAEAPETHRESETSSAAR
jgi:hypothetical protein